MVKLKWIYWAMVACIALGIVLFFTVTANAANHYILAGASGTADGSDWTNAWTDIPAMTSITRGDSIFIGDGTYTGNKTLNKAASGVTFITWIKATVANHGTATGWNNDFGDGQANFTGSLTLSTPCQILEGVSGSGMDSTSYGFRLNKSPVANQHNIAISADSIFIRHCAITTCGEDNDIAARCINITSGSASNWVTNFQVQNNYLYNSSAQMMSVVWSDSFKINDNIFNGLHNSVGGIHGVGLQMLWTNDGLIYNNTFKDISGTGAMDWVSGTEDSISVYNNLFYQTSSRYTYSNGFLASTSSSASATNILVYNNTIVNCTGINQGVWFYAGSGNIVKNNLWYNCTKIQIMNATHDYNASESATDSVGVEAHNVVLSADPFANLANYDFALKSGSQAIDAGDSTDVTWTTDLAGNDRIQGANIDIGALEYNTDPTPPSDLTNTVNLPQHSVHTFVDNSSDEEGFQVTINGTVTDSLAANTETFSIDNQTPGTTYNVQIRAYKGDYLSGATVVNFTAPRYRLGRVR